MKIILVIAVLSGLVASFSLIKNIVKYSEIKEDEVLQIQTINEKRKAFANIELLLRDFLNKFADGDKSYC